MVSVGERVAQRLEAAGIGVIQDKTLHDNPSYSGSYEQSRKSMASYLEQYPSICLVLDLHRDAAEDGNGNQVGYTVQTPEGAAAKLMLVLGTNDGGLYHPNWQENLALGLKLTVLLEQQNPGICRPIDLRTQRFNMDLCPGALLVEVGAEGNTFEQAQIAVHALAEAILILAKGAN
jgi:stage II sporulation protein P